MGWHKSEATTKWYNCFYFNNIEIVRKLKYLKKKCFFVVLTLFFSVQSKTEL